MQLSHATSELENIINSFGKVSIGALYGIGTTSFLMFVYPFKLFYRRVFKRQVEIASKKKIKV